MNVVVAMGHTWDSYNYTLTDKIKNMATVQGENWVSSVIESTAMKCWTHPNMSYVEMEES